MQRVYCLLFLAAAAGLAPTAAAQSPTAIALSGAASPFGGTYSGFITPLINNAGTVAFRADLSGAGGSATSGLFAGAPGAIQTVAVRGGATPAGGTYTNTPIFSDFVLSGSGQLLFRAGTTVSPGLFAGPVGGLQTVAINGGATPAGGTYSTLGEFNEVAMNAAGKAAFGSALTGGSGTRGVFAGLPGAVAALGDNGAAAPNGAGTYIDFSDPRVNAGGQVAFGARTLTGGGIFLAAADNTVSAVAVQGDAAPGGGTYSGLNLGPVVPSLNAAGQVAFRVSVQSGTNYTGVVAGTPGALQSIARTGDAAPGPAGGTYSTLTGTPLINAAGQVLFQSTVRTAEPGDLRPTLFLGTAAAVQQVAQAQGPAPGGGTYFIVGTASLNAAGQVAYTASLVTGLGGVTSANNLGLYAGTPGAMQLLVRKGDVIDVDPGTGTDLRTVRDIEFVGGSGGGDGLATGLSDAGTVVYTLEFTDNSSGVFTSIIPVPEPAGLLAVAAGVAGLAARRRAKRSPS